MFWAASEVLYYFRFKFPYPLQWGPPTFSAGHSFAMMSAVLVSMVEVFIEFLKGVSKLLSKLMAYPIESQEPVDRDSSFDFTFVMLF